MASEAIRKSGVNCIATTSREKVTLTLLLSPSIVGEQVRTEIFDSKKLLEDRFGREVKHFCYPYGDYNEAIRDLVGEAGYASATTVEFGSVQAASHPHALPRVMATDVPPRWRVAAKKLWHGMQRLH